MGFKKPRDSPQKHNAPWTLAKLREASGIDFNKIKYNDEKVYRMLWDKSVIYDQLTPEQQEAFEKHFDKPGLNNGLPEFSTDFLGQVCGSIKPVAFDDVVKINGITHGKGLWLNNSQKEDLEKNNITIDEVFGCRENTFKFLKDGGIEEIKAFYIVESLRKGKKLKPEELELVKNCKLNKFVIKNILKINYLFPESHAISYSRDMANVATYKLYYPDAFYPVLLSQYARDVSDFNYEEVAACETLDQLKGICKTYAVGQKQDVIIKCKTRLAWLIWEAKLRGYNLKTATLFSLPKEFSLSKDDGKTILMPLTSITGVAEGSAVKIYETIKNKALMSYDDLLSRKDDSNRAIFNKRVLEGLGLYELTREQVERFNEYLVKHNGQS